MMHWSASRSDEYCSCDSTAALSLCGAAKSCPKSDEFAALWDTFSVKASIQPGILDAVCGAAYNPTAFSCGHRKRQANAARPGFGYTWPAVASDDRFRTKPAPVAAEFPEGQTRRMKSWDYWPRAVFLIGEEYLYIARELSGKNDSESERRAYRRSIAVLDKTFRNRSQKFFIKT